SAAGCSAYAGIPLTHRGISRRVQFVTGHFRENEPLDINWDKLADPQSTLVIYMGLANLDIICQSLMNAGLDGETPVAAVQDATTSSQKRLISNLINLPAAVRESELQAPVIVIVGEVVSLADDLDWFCTQDKNSLTKDRVNESISA
ncbi:MAG: uroporphyrinogen-III C-methyltransferase, partial [Gammaproteobacteria bacterium]|nr:uroporphyrinogen-III C-methyltransferase [Gammaproteobacteria bacterium]